MSAVFRGREGQGVAVLGSESVVFSRNRTTGKLTYMEMYQDGLDNVDGLNAATHSTVSPDGNYLYVTGPGDNAVVVFQRPSTAAFSWPMFIPAITGAGK